MAVELAQEIDISLIRIDGDTQPRAELNHDTINDYAQSMNEGDVFPPIIVHYDGQHYWLTDGFHRYHAAKLAGRDAIDASSDTLFKTIHDKLEETMQKYQNTYFILEDNNPFALETGMSEAERILADASQDDTDEEQEQAS